MGQSVALTRMPNLRVLVVADLAALKAARGKGDLHVEVADSSNTLTEAAIDGLRCPFSAPFTQGGSLAVEPSGLLSAPLAKSLISAETFAPFLSPYSLRRWSESQ
jgi:hypothetical protein